MINQKANQSFDIASWLFWPEIRGLSVPSQIQSFCSSVAKYIWIPLSISWLFFTQKFLVHIKCDDKRDINSGLHYMLRDGSVQNFRSASDFFLQDRQGPPPVGFKGRVGEFHWGGSRVKSGAKFPHSKVFIGDKLIFGSNNLEGG